MSGHSKWAKIKRAKGANDAKRGAIFTKLGKAITLAASEGGGDADMNFALRLAVDKAKEANMPGDNIERAIKKGTGALEGGKIERISYEAYGPATSALIIDCSTDNTNRTLAEVRGIVESAGGKFASVGSVSWQFDEKGSILVKPAKLKKAEKFGAEDTYVEHDKDEIMMELMEIEGVEDIIQSTEEDEDGNVIDVMEVITGMTSFAQVDKELKAKGIQVVNSELSKIAKETREFSDIDQDKINKLIDNLEESDDVDSVWTNVK